MSFSLILDIFSVLNLTDGHLYINGLWIRIQVFRAEMDQAFDWIQNQPFLLLCIDQRYNYSLTQLTQIYILAQCW